MEKDFQDETPHSLTETTYRQAFPASETRPFLPDARKYVIEERLGLMPVSGSGQAEMISGLQAMGFTGSMLGILRQRSTGELALFSVHAHDLYSGDIGRGKGLPSSLGGLNPAPNLSITFNRALRETDSDLVAIGQAVAALTGRMPPGGGKSR